MAEARIYPPSDQRIAEARRAGHVPRGSFVVFSAALAGVSSGLDAWGEGGLVRLGALWRDLLEQYARGESPEVSQVLLVRVPQALWPLLALLFGVFVVAVALAFLAQGSARLLPLQRMRRSFSRLPAPRTSKLLWCVLVSLLALTSLHEFVRSAPDTMGLSFSRWLWRLSALAALLAVLDVLLARTSFMRSLWLTRREHLDDQREAYGSPEMRSARARLRRESSFGSQERRP